MPHHIDFDHETSLHERLPSSPHLALTRPIYHPIVQLDEVIKQAEMAEVPYKLQKILEPIQESIMVREQHYKDALKEKDMQILGLKLELSQAKATAREQEKEARSIREDLRVTKGDNRRLRREAQVDRETMQRLEMEKVAWLRGNGGGIEELERDIAKLEGVRSDLHTTAESLRGVLKGQEDELLDYKVKDFAQRGEIHLLKKDVERLKNRVELNRAAADWLAENGPSLKADFFSLRDEVANLRAKGQDVARMMARSAKDWKNTVAGTNGKGGPSKHLDTKKKPELQKDEIHDKSYKRYEGEEFDDKLWEAETVPGRRVSKRRRRTVRIAAQTFRSRLILYALSRRTSLFSNAD
ncbi:hypothetical protein VTL71DRAFT_9737 [Oculimacula yallundae]|uniref:Uncharacterized protein n=1 Tax=Oculimacula yallundae TaxID=86028 RepID=A0ABR4BRP2_9HELO